jgi:aldehyde:ferredoxin oxidoreductase
MERIITIDLTDSEITENQTEDKHLFLGGRGLTSNIISEELDPLVEPFSPDNLLVFAPGLLAGYYLSSANRLSVGGKSPLTLGIKESNSGGTGAFHLARLGVKLLKITGSAGLNSSTGIVLSDTGISITDCKYLEGKGTYETTRILQDKYGKHSTVISIGPAGERLYKTASICATDMDGEPCRIMARGGLGAVMGSKGLKAIVICPSKNITKKASPALSQMIKDFAKTLKDNPVTGDLFPKYGTAMTLNNVNKMGGLPTRNFSSGTYDRADDINGDALRNTIIKRGGNTTHACMPGCVIKCSNKYVLEDGSALVGALDYETICLMGSNLDISNLDTIARLNYLCNDIGIDTMETGAAMGVLSESGTLEFGNDEKYIEALESIISNYPGSVGELITKGAVECGKAVGVKRVPAVKGQSMAAYDPRVIKGLGITYALSPMGADHTAGNAVTLNVDHNDIYSLVEPVRDLNIQYYVLDTLGLCIFTGRVSLADPEFMARIVSEVTGIKTNYKTLYDQAESDLFREIEFNRKAGLTEETDKIPSFMMDEKLEPNNTVFDVPESEMNKFFLGH